MSFSFSPRKCGIIGCGNVGATIAYTYATSGLFSEIVLIDKNEKRAQSEALDLSHSCAFSSPVRIVAGNYSDISDAQIVVITAGVAQKPGETRLQLLERNLRIFSEIVPSIVRYNRDAVLLVVTNPVDILTAFTKEIAGLPEGRVLGSGTVLDTARLKQIMGSYLSVDARHVHTFVIGEHGDSELPVWTGANISGMDLPAYLRHTGKCADRACLDEMFESVRCSAYRIIEGKGATYYGVARAVERITESIFGDENAVLPVSVDPKGAYGISGVCLGLPAVVGIGGVKDVIEIPLSKEEKQALLDSAQTMKDEMERCSIYSV